MQTWVGCGSQLYLMPFALDGYWFIRKTEEPQCCLHDWVWARHCWGKLAIWIERSAEGRPWSKVRNWFVDYSCIIASSDPPHQIWPSWSSTDRPLAGRTTSHIWDRGSRRDGDWRLWVSLVITSRSTVHWKYVGSDAQHHGFICAMEIFLVSETTIETETVSSRQLDNIESSLHTFNSSTSPSLIRSNTASSLKIQDSGLVQPSIASELQRRTTATCSGVSTPEFDFLSRDYTDAIFGSRFVQSAAVEWGGRECLFFVFSVGLINMYSFWSHQMVHM